MQLALALVITIVSACCLNLGYLIEHEVASQLPKLSIKQPIRSVKLLAGNRRWLTGFGIEAVGWGLYVVALALAPLSLVQATAAGGIGILALMVSRIKRVPLSGRERVGVLVSVSGLALLGVSLVGGHEDGSKGDALHVLYWLAASAVIAVVAIKALSPVIGGAPAYGLATGILFAGGDVATKMAVSGGIGLVFFVALIAFYGLGTGVLQAGFQRGGALTTAGIATLFTNALPIVAGMTIFEEPLPGGWAGALRVVAFVAVVAGAVALAKNQEPEHDAAAPEPELRPVDARA